MDNKDIQTFYAYNFDFKHQDKNNYDDALAALKVAFIRRSNGKLFTGLSSGYDSGLTCNLLLDIGSDFKCYTILAREKIETIQQRLKKWPGIKHEFLNPDIKFHKDYLTKHAAPFNYQIYYDNKGWYLESYLNDYASMGTSAIAQKALQDGYNVYISTQGADEIISDYSLIPSQSYYKGIFASNLTPWPNFYTNCNYSYLGKEARVGEAWGIEARYPFLDVDFVQEFLWLTPELKNRNYKSVIYEYLKMNNIPFNEGVKQGFNI
jgi:asparagine synthetase B (glutamine-hydrolysing)